MAANPRPAKPGLVCGSPRAGLGLLGRGARGSCGGAGPPPAGQGGPLPGRRLGAAWRGTGRHP
eukprot:14965504-Alexandrium_andersonii.AAC.1